MQHPHEFLNAFQGHPLEQIEGALKDLLNQRLENPADHLAWARVADELGLPALAFREAQLAVRFQPEDPEGLLLLAPMFYERGRTERAQVHLENLLKRYPDHVAARALKAELEEVHSPEIPLQLEQPIPEEETAPDDYQAFRFLQAFSGREDTYARQWYSKEQGRGG